MKVITTIAAASMAIAGVAVDADHTSRQLIVRGNVVPKHMKEYVVGLRLSAGGENICGAALIAPDLVLTTARCAAKHCKQTPLYASVGSHYLFGQLDGEQIEVASVQNHTKHDPDADTYDFALLTLAKPSTYTAIRLPEAHFKARLPRIDSTALGWGKTKDGGPLSKVLRSVTLPLWDQKECDEYLTNFVEPKICVGGVLGEDVCDGDDGGPLILENGKGDSDDVLIGLFSFGFMCGKSTMPTVFARVADAVDWINSVKLCGGAQQC